MFTALLDASVIDGAFPLVVYGLGIVALVAILWRRPSRAWAARYLVAAVVGLALGYLIAWYLGDVRGAFGIDLTFATRSWFAVGTAGGAIAIVSLWSARGWRIPVGIASILVFALVAATGINATIGQFPTLGSALGASSVSQLKNSAGHGAAPTGQAALWKVWRAPANLPKYGRLGTEAIPATVSHFRAQRAVVYLPPAALVRHAPALPVLVFLGGQPGTPQTVVTAGQLPEVMNAFARAHDGLAPIVVVPDQLGAPQNNPMCVNSKLGNVATYLTVDVPNWIRRHLNVLPSRIDWTIGGFSEGGTCSIQLGTRYRGIFGNILDVSGQVAPSNGTFQHTVDAGFHGSIAAFRDDSPLHLLEAGAPFRSTDAVFAVGQNDATYRPETAIVSAAARRAGMTTWSFLSPGTAHDWYTEQYGLKVGLETLAARLGLRAAADDVKKISHA